MGLTFPILLGLHLFFLDVVWLVDGFTANPVQIPDFDLSTLGRVAFTGDFEALSLYQYSQQSNPLPAGNGSQSVLQQLPNGDFTIIATADGYIDQVGTFVVPDGDTVLGIVVVGNFTSIGGVETQGITMFEPISGKMIPMPGLAGTVNALLTDEATDASYAGGGFKGANSSNAIAWVGRSGWTDLPFLGFNGPVNSITKLSDGSLAFGGSFDNIMSQSYAADTGLLSPGNSTALSGLFGFDPNTDTASISGRSGAVTRTKLNSGAVVNDLVSYKDCLFVAGALESPGLHNIFIIENDTSVALAGGGLNAGVNTLYLAQNMLFAGGNFTDTANKTTGNLTNVAVYSILDQHWQALGAGVNGAVFQLNPLKVNVTQGSTPETVIVVNGDFDQLLAFENNSMATVNGLGIWVPSAKNWLQNLAIEQQAFYGQLRSCTTYNSSAQDTELFCVGTLSSYGLKASSAIGLSFDQSKAIDISTLGLNTIASDGSGAATGLFYQENGLNLTIIAGQFLAQASDKSVVRNLAFINSTDKNAVVSGITSNYGNTSIIQCLATQSDVLYGGGIITGMAGSQNVDGIFAYNLSQHDFSVDQPPALAGDDVEVKAMLIKPNDHQLYVGGSFQKAGLLDCPSVCVYNPTSQKWSRPGAELSGSVTYLTWADDETLVAAGNLTVSGVSYSLATYYVPDGEWTPFRKDQPIPGPITAISPSSSQGQGTSTGSTGWSSDSTGFWIAGTSANGSAFLTKWGNGTWSSVGQIFGNQTKITGVEVMTIKQHTNPNDFLESGQILILTGSLSIPNAGNASAALFNGTNIWPLVLTLNADGNPGSLSSMFSEQKISFAPAQDMKGTVVAIAIAVIAALISIIIIGEVSEIGRRYWLRKKGYDPLSRRRET